MVLGRLFGLFGRLFSRGEPLAADEESQSDKKQWMEEKKQLEKELDDARKNHEAEISKLKEKLKNQDSSSANQNESIKSQAGAMKSQYEDRIGKLEGGQGPQSREQLIAEVKRVMSSVYHSLKGQFEEKNKYEGADINKTIMATIKDVTLQMMTDEEEETSKAAVQGEPKIVGVIKKESSPITGDKGNPYYAEELSKKVDLLRKLSGGVKPGVGTDSIEAEPDKETDPLIDPIIAPIEVTSTGGTGKETGGGPGKAVLVEAPPTTGGWGNPYREAEAKEINRKQKEAGVSGSAKDDDDPVIDTIISPVPAYMTGGEGKLTENGGGPGEAVLVEAPPTTGGWGNPYRAAEAMEIDRKQKEKCQDEVREQLISSAAATSSEDKGTAELQKEKKSKDESNKIVKPDQPVPSKDESKKVETTGATAEKSKDKKPETGKSQDSESTNKQSSPVKTSKSTDKSSKSSTDSAESSKPLIGEEDLKKATKSAKPKPTAQLDSDDDLKGKPPPLFGDEEDDNDDLDWLS